MGFLVFVFLHKNEIMSIKLGFADFTHWGGIIAAPLCFVSLATRISRYSRKGVARYNRENTGFTVKCDGTATDPHGTLTDPHGKGCMV